jgi:hypothetical protein
LHADNRSSLYLSIAPTDAKPGPREPARDSTKKDSSKAKSRAAKKPDAKKDEKDTTTIDLTVELVDANNNTARLALTRYGMPRRPLETHVLRRADRERTAFANTYEIVLQTYVMPLADFVAASPQFAPDKLKSIRLVFDRVPAGTIILDDVGISAIDPAFFAQARP